MTLACFVDDFRVALSTTSCWERDGQCSASEPLSSVSRRAGDVCSQSGWTKQGEWPWKREREVGVEREREGGRERGGGRGREIIERERERGGGGGGE